MSEDIRQRSVDSDDDFGTQIMLMDDEEDESGREDAR